MRLMCVCLCLLLAACGADGDAGAPAGSLTVEVSGPAFADDTEAVDAFTAAFQDLDYDEIHSAWGRMTFQQRRAADLAVGQWMDGLSSDDYARYEDAQEMLRAFDWGAMQQ